MANNPTNLAQWMPSERAPDVIVNAIHDALSPSSLYGRNAEASAGLTWGYYGGYVPVAGVPTLIADSFITLTASATCYIRKLDSTGVVSHVTSAPTAWPALNGGYTPLYDAVTDANGVTSWNDYRAATLFSAASITTGGPPTGTAGGDLSGTYPDPTVNKGALVESLIMACSDETTALTAATGKITLRMPYAFTVTAVRCSLTTAQTSGSIFTIDINEAGTTILSTKLTIDNTEKTSTTAATAAVISDSSIADDAEITVDIDQIGDGTAKGLKVVLIGHRT